MNKYEYKTQQETLQEVGHIGVWEFDITTKKLFSLISFSVSSLELASKIVIL